MKLNLARIDWNRLRVFHAVHGVGSVQGAARSLGVTSSAVSQSLKRLESELELRLFQRLGNRLKPTRAAEELAIVVSRFEGEVTRVVTELRTLRDEPHGTIRIGSAFEFGTRVVIPEMQTFERYPRLAFRISFGVPQQLMQALVSDQLDLVFSDDGPFLKRYASLVVFEPVFREKLVLVCSRRFAEKVLGDGRAFAHLTALPHVDYVSDLSVVSIWYRHHFKRAPARLHLALVSENVQAILAGVRSGLGLGMVPEYLITEELARGQLVKVSPRRKELTNAIVLARLKDHVPSLGERMFAERIRAGTRGLGVGRSR